MIEEINTNSNFSEKEIPDGDYSFRVLSTRKNGSMYIWSFSYGDGKEGEMVFFANNMGPLLKVLGCEEIPEKKGFYKFDTEVTDGVPFKATVYSEPDKKDKSILRKRMKNYDELPF